MITTNSELFKSKAKSQIGRWFTDRSEVISPTDYYYCYAVEFVDKINDWELQLYKFDTMFNTIEKDTIYLEDLPEYLTNVSKKTGWKIYNTVRTNIETLLYANPEDLETVL